MTNAYGDRTRPRVSRRWRIGSSIGSGRVACSSPVACEPNRRDACRACPSRSGAGTVCPSLVAPDLPTAHTATDRDRPRARPPAHRAVVALAAWRCVCLTQAAWPRRPRPGPPTCLGLIWVWVRSASGLCQSKVPVRASQPFLLQSHEMFTTRDRLLHRTRVPPSASLPPVHVGLEVQARARSRARGLSLLLSIMSHGRGRGEGSDGHHSRPATAGA